MARKAAGGNGQGSADIELDISDFGPIARGRIALRPLTILVGPNNSGKTYASVLAHSVMSSCADLAAAARSGNWAGQLLESGAFHALSGRMARLAPGNGKDGAHVPRDLAESIHGCAAGRFFEEALLSHMRRNFGSPLGDLVRTGARRSKIRIGGPMAASVSISCGGRARVGVDPALPRRPVRRARALAESGAKRWPGGAASGGRSGIRATERHVDGRRGHAALLGLAAAMAGHASMPIPSGASHYLPAARSGIMCALGALAPGILQGFARGPQGGTVVPGTLSDLADSITRRGEPRAGGPDGRRGVIPDLFGGSVGWQGTGAISYRHLGAQVPIHRSASGIAETAPLALAVARMGAGDTLIVEEPEAHLHPKSQVPLARHLVGLVRRGMRVILSTHSDFLLEQLDIFVKLGSLTPSKRARRGYGKGDYVLDEEIAPYAFARSAKGGHTISELEHSADDGISYEGFIDVVESMAEDDYGIYVARGKRW